MTAGTALCEAAIVFQESIPQSIPFQLSMSTPTTTLFLLSPHPSSCYDCSPIKCRSKVAHYLKLHVEFANEKQRVTSPVFLLRPILPSGARPRYSCAGGSCELDIP